jgi:lipopolysaccharide export system permease protein
MFGTILQRMIFWELVRVFLLALVSLTGLFLLGGVVTEATQRGLSLVQVFTVIPLLIPNTLPYTIPATTLFATCVVYGRLSHDNEVTAIRAAGVHLGRIIAPSVLLGLLTAGGTAALYYDFIPRTHQLLRTQVVGNLEDFLYGILKKQGGLSHPKKEYALWVRQVQGKRLIDVIYKVRDKEGGYTLVARARDASVQVDMERNVIRVDMSHVTTCDKNGVAGYIGEQTQEVPIPDEIFGTYTPRPSDLNWGELLQRRTDVAGEVRQAIEDTQKDLTGLAPETQAQFKNHYDSTKVMKQREQNTVEAELHMRPALAIGCLCFALIGGPVGIWFSRADYLSAFVSCFLPTVVVYYPLLLCGTNLAKDGRLAPAIALWMANAAIGAAAVIQYWRLIRR